MLKVLSACEAMVADFWKMILPTSLPAPINLFGKTDGEFSAVAAATLEY